MAKWDDARNESYADARNARAEAAKNAAAAQRQKDMADARARQSDLTKLGISSDKEQNQIEDRKDLLTVQDGTIFKSGYAFHRTIDKVNSAANAENYGSTFKDFLNNFSGVEGFLAQSVDPQTSFDVTFDFEPYDSKIAANLSYFLAHTSNHYIDQENANKNGIGASQAIQLGLYVQNIEVPQFKMLDGQKVESIFGTFPTNGAIAPDNNQLQVAILNTRQSLHENIFYPWMREAAYPQWSYDSQPYTTARIIIDFTKHNQSKYYFCGCRPCQIISQHPTHEVDAGSVVRVVSFLFDFMYVVTAFDPPVQKQIASVNQAGIGDGSPTKQGVYRDTRGDNVPPKTAGYAKDASKTPTFKKKVDDDRNAARARMESLF